MWDSRCPGNSINDTSFDTGNIVADIVPKTYFMCKLYDKSCNGVSEEFGILAKTSHSLS